MNRIELLAPAGNFEALRAAVESGADAVYMGGSRFNARAFADNFDDGALKSAVRYAHIRGVRIYITVNILISDGEMEEVLDYIKYLYSIDVDAIIIQDIALLKLAREMLPDFELHCSTQMTVHSSETAEYLAGMGASRIVVARELSVEEINKIKENTGVEVEAFVHGALCVCYSGQCYMSSMIGGRSGNRGRCAQPCRRKYSFFDLGTGGKLDKHEGKHILSTRDLNTYARLKELAASGIASLKIEGRMKRPEYVAAVVKNYRTAIDELAHGAGDYYSEAADAELAAIFNREFTEGYLFNKRNKDIVSIDRPDNRGVYIGKVVAMKGRIASVRIEKGMLNDGDGIEIVDRNGNAAGTLISGIKVRGVQVDSADSGDIAEVFIRENVTAGSVVNKTYDSRLHKKINEEYYYENKKKIPVNGEISIHIDKKPAVRLWDDSGSRIEATGEMAAAEAQKVPLTKDKVLEQFSKTGDTPYIFDKLDIQLDSNSFVPVKELNGIRRLAIEKLNDARSVLNKDRDVTAALKLDIRAFMKSQADKLKSGTGQAVAGSTAELIAGIKDMEAAKAAIAGGADTIYLISGFDRQPAKLAWEIKKLCDSSKVNFFIVLPIISKDNENLEIERLLADLYGEYKDMGVVVSNLGQLRIAQRIGIRRLRTNYSLNLFNSSGAALLKSLGAECMALSPELSLKQIGNIYLNTNAELEGFVYGHMPLMTLEYCPASLLNECGSCKAGSNRARSADSIEGSEIAIADEKGKLFPIVKLKGCRTQLLNSDAFFLLKDLDKLLQSGISKLRSDFYMENTEEIYEIISSFRNKDREVNERLVEKMQEKGFTKGHYFRGIV